MLATAILTSMVFWMKKAARSIKAQMHDSIDAALRPGDRQGLALVGMAFFAVGREGLESGVLPARDLPAERGLARAGRRGARPCVGGRRGFAIYYGGVRLDLRRFFRWTGVFIIFVAAGLLAGALRAFHEAGLWNGLQGTAFDLSACCRRTAWSARCSPASSATRTRRRSARCIVYLAFLVPALVLLLRAARPRRSRAPRRSSPRPDALAISDHEGTTTCRTLAQPVEARPLAAPLAVLARDLGGQALGQADAAPIAPGPILIT